MYVKWVVTGLGLLMAVVDFVGWGDLVEAGLDSFRKGVARATIRLMHRVNAFYATLAGSALIGIPISKLLYPHLWNYYYIGQPLGEEFYGLLYVASIIYGTLMIPVSLVITFLVFRGILHILNMGPKGTTGSIGLILAVAGSLI